jgi:predicted DCC family thiol-disulfide oxidoreductase YuxK
MGELPRSSQPEGGAVILFDGVCNLCNSSIQFVIRRDPQARFSFAPLQSVAADSLLKSTGAAPLPDSIVLVQRGRVYTQSGAVLRIARGLRGLWPLAYAFIVIPRPLRDLVYRLIARNRYRWFGKREACMMPTEEIRARFL